MFSQCVATCQLAHPQHPMSQSATPPQKPQNMNSTLNSNIMCTSSLHDIRQSIQTIQPRGGKKNNQLQQSVFSINTSPPQPTKKQKEKTKTLERKMKIHVKTVWCGVRWSGRKGIFVGGTRGREERREQGKVFVSTPASRHLLPGELRTTKDGKVSSGRERGGIHIITLKTRNCCHGNTSLLV